MSNNSTRIKQVFFADSVVPDSDVIVENLATEGATVSETSAIVKDSAEIILADQFAF